MLPEERREMEAAKRTEMISDTQKDAEKFAGLIKKRELPLLMESVDKLDSLLPETSKAPFEALRNLNKALYAADQDIRRFCDAVRDFEKYIFPPKPEQAAPAAKK